MSLWCSLSCNMLSRTAALNWSQSSHGKQTETQGGTTPGTVLGVFISLPQWKVKKSNRQENMASGAELAAWWAQHCPPHLQPLGYGWEKPSMKAAAQGGKLKPVWVLLSSGHLLMSKLDGYNGQILIFIILTPGPHYQRWLFLTSLVRHAVLSIKLYKFVRDNS